KPEKDLRRVEVNGWVKDALGVEHVKGRQQHGHESSLPGARAHGLDDVVLARVSTRGSQDEHQRDETEEGRNHGKVWSKAELENTVGIGATDNQRNDKSYNDGTCG